MFPSQSLESGDNNSRRIGKEADVFIGSMLEFQFRGIQFIVLIRAVADKGPDGGHLAGKTQQVEVSEARFEWLKVSSAFKNYRQPWRFLPMGFGLIRNRSYWLSTGTNHLSIFGLRTLSLTQPSRKGQKKSSMASLAAFSDACLRNSVARDIPFAFSSLKLSM